MVRMIGDWDLNCIRTLNKRLCNRQITGRIDEGLIDVLPESVRFICHNVRVFEVIVPFLSPRSESTDMFREYIELPFPFLSLEILCNSILQPKKAMLTWKLPTGSWIRPN